MVNEKVLIRDKFRKHKKFTKFFIVLITLAIIMAGIFLAGFLTKNTENKIILENPLKNIVFANTNEQGLVNKQAVIEQAILEFNEEYINYLLVALGINNLYKSYLGYGNPSVEFVLDKEIWTSEVIENNLQTIKSSTENEDLRIIISKEEAIEAILSSDIETFMKNSVTNGNTQIEMIAGKVELASKGYLSMYKDITSEELSIENGE